LRRVGWLRWSRDNIGSTEGKEEGREEKEGKDCSANVQRA